MFDAARLRNDFSSRCGQTATVVAESVECAIRMVPCSLLYIETNSAGSPNCKNVDPFCYLEQAITLNRSLKAAGLPALTVATNVADQVARYLEDVNPDSRPHVLQLERSTLELPKMTRFYSAHFKLDMIERLGAMLQDGELLMVLDTDMLALHAVNEELLRRCWTTGVGAFDISDQEFSAYGVHRVIADLDTVAGTCLRNPRWFGGEVLIASAGFISELVPCAHACFDRYREVIQELNHNGDEVFVSAALNLLADDGHQIIDLGAHRLVGRHWSGNTHRDLRWFKGCSLLHLPGCKRLLERQARRPVFSAAHVWRSLVLMHAFNRTIWPLRRWVRSKGRPRRESRLRHAARGRATRVDALVLDPDARRRSRLVSRLTSQGMRVMSASTREEALNGARRLSPRVIVSASPLGVVDACGLFDELREASDSPRRPVMIAFSTDDARLDWAEWDQWLPRSTAPSEVARSVAQALEPR